MDELKKNSQVDDLGIESLIKVIRGCHVLLDRDLARLYGVETRRLNEQVKRNIERFPADFMFQLTREEFGHWRLNEDVSYTESVNSNDLMSQFATSSWGGARKLPYAFTEQGIAMLSGVLRSSIAVEVNIRIMRAFVSMRHILSAHTELNKRLEVIEFHQLSQGQQTKLIEQKLSEHENRIDEVFHILDQKADIPDQGIFYNGQVYDAYSFVTELVRSATVSIVLIDNYIDDSVLTMLDKRATRVSATIYTSRISKELEQDLSHHNQQYPEIMVYKFTLSHDRFLCIDESVYHIGASIKDLGKKWFAFAKLDFMTTSLLLAHLTSASSPTTTQ